MTTASALVVDAGNFRGQSETRWTNPGQTASIRITKALSVRATANEVEEEGGRDVVRIGGSDYQRVKVKCTLTMENFRDHEVTMVVSPQFSGELVEAAENPKSTLRADGAISVNPRRELEWTLKLPSKGNKMLTYRYSVLVPR